jgi:hypothetical protein
MSSIALRIQIRILVLGGWRGKDSGRASFGVGGFNYPRPDAEEQKGDPC